MQGKIQLEIIIVHNRLLIWSITGCIIFFFFFQVGLTIVDLIDNF